MIFGVIELKNTKFLDQTKFPNSDWTSDNFVGKSFLVEPETFQQPPVFAYFLFEAVTDITIQASKRSRRREKENKNK